MAINYEEVGELVDDVAGRTLVSMSTTAKALKGDVGDADKSEAAKKVGAALAQKCLALKIDKVVFDRNGYKYHGRVKMLADGAREAGLKF